MMNDGEAANMKMKGVGDAKTSALGGRGIEAKEHFNLPTLTHE